MEPVLHILHIILPRNRALDNPLFGGKTHQPGEAMHPSYVVFRRDYAEKGN